MVSFNKAVRFTKTNIASIPNDKAIIYKIKNATGKNLYTGIAGRGRCQDRLMEHKELKREIIPGGTRFQIAQVKTKDKAAKIEEQIIENEKPKFNEQGK